ncbi:hypothetical protein [Caldinitratiruptor microaerophilus]|uniref:Uncharacterized protein n=1 Tax=Caldinitratiruptor microaerophilus TaxID=671077 RepID=A0AA35CJB3_9FIRM|nr:hypothetical protein [Caldinitratiruptor microaerophilus]BDG59499.1 hypothetical protein caldi_05890 [Caldinitratiruptor microaerophilus]
MVDTVQRRSLEAVLGVDDGVPLEGLAWVSRDRMHREGADGGFEIRTDEAPGASVKKGEMPIVLLGGEAIVNLPIEKDFGIRRWPLTLYTDALDGGREGETRCGSGVLQVPDGLVEPCQLVEEVVEPLLQLVQTLPGLRTEGEEVDPDFGQAPLDRTDSLRKLGLALLKRSDLLCELGLALLEPCHPGVDLVETFQDGLEQILRFAHPVAPSLVMLTASAGLATFPANLPGAAGTAHAVTAGSPQGV